ncbi:MAG: LamG-like jellyroll fold domain-containing protein [Paludibacter sp.]
MKTNNTKLFAIMAITFFISISAFASKTNASVMKAATDIAASGNALNFDGVNDFIDAGNAASVQLNQGTIEAWIKTGEAGDSYRGIVVKQWAYGLFLEGNELIAFSWDGSGGIYTGVKLNDNAWHHVALSFNFGVTDGTRIYIDGVLKNTFTYGLGNQGSNLGIACGNVNGSNSYQNFAGLIDEVRVWNTVRTASEIQSTMNTELVGNESGLVTYYNFNQGVAGGNNSAITTEPNLVSGGNNGILNNFAKTGSTSNFVDGFTPPAVYIVTGANYSSLNGTYTEAGIVNGQPYFIYNDGGTEWGIAFNQGRWMIGEHMGGGDVMDYEMSSDAGSPALTGWSGGVVLTRQGPNLTYSATTINELPANVGTFNSSVTITHNNYSGNELAGTNDEDFIASGKVVVTNIPAGLAVSVIRNNNLQLTLSVTGTATSHTNANDINNLNIQFQNTAFSNGDAAGTTGSNTNLTVNFIQEITVGTGQMYSTLQAAVDAAGNGDILKLSAETFTQNTVNITNKSLSIIGQGAGLTIIQPNAAPATAVNQRVFNISNSTYSEQNNHVFENVTVRNGTWWNGGAGIYANNTTLKIKDCAITSNYTTMSSGGGVGDGGGGVYASTSNLFVENSTFSDNRHISPVKPGVWMGGGAIAFTCDNAVNYMTVSNSTFSNNSSGNLGGAILVKQTVAKDINIVNSTFVGNSAAYGGAFAGEGTTNPQPTYFKNCIMYGNIASVAGSQLFTTETTNYTFDNCIIQNTSAGGLNGVYNNCQVAVNPLLGTLADNGGSTKTCALLAGSPAINAGTTGLLVPTTDQRGYSKIGTRDIGAYEVAVGISTDAVTNATATTATYGGNVTGTDGASVTARGICWSTSTLPTVSDAHTTDGLGVGSFKSAITGLTAGTSYYVRAYSTNSNGTYYGNQVSFIYKNADIVLTGLVDPTIKDIAVASGTKFATDVADQTVHGITVQPGGKLDLTNALTVSGDVNLKADNTGSFSANIAAGLTVSGTLNYIKTMDANRWYFMSFPCNVDANAIKQVGGTLGTLGVDWYIKEYDGASRIVNLGTISNWKPIVGTTLVANKGYIIGLESYKGTQDISFPLDKALVQAAENAPRTISNPVITAYGANAAVASNHKGWNLVGQPFLSKFSGANASGGASGNALTYISVPVGVSGATYSQSVKATFNNIEPFSAYFIQVDADLANTGLSFAVGGRHLAPSVVDTDLSDRVQLNFTTATGTDNTNLVMDDSQTTAYEMNKDLEKMIGTGTAQPQVYTQLNGINYAYNALPIANVNNLALGFYSKTATETVISAVATAPSLSSLLLTDTSNGVVTDLLTNSYKFTPTASGTNNTRFSISAQRILTENVVATEKNGPQILITPIAIGAKLIINNLDGIANVRVYDAIGRMVVNKTATGNTMEIKLNAVGVYTVQIQCGEKSWTKKIIAH